MNKEKVNAIIRLIVTAVLMVNMGLTVAGKNPIPLDESVLTEWLSTAAAGLAVLWSWWKDAPMTKEAVEAHRTMVGDKIYKKLNSEAQEELSNGGELNE